MSLRTPPFAVLVALLGVGCVTNEQPYFHYTKKDGSYAVTPYAHRGIYPSPTDDYTGYGSGLRRSPRTAYYGSNYGYCPSSYHRNHGHHRHPYAGHHGDRSPSKSKGKSGSSSRSRSSKDKSSSSTGGGRSSEKLLRDRGRGSSGGTSESRPARGRRLESGGGSKKKSGRGR